MADYIFLRPSGYYFRYARPARFKSVLPVRELRYPLHTHEQRVAKRLAAYIFARVEWLLIGIKNSRMELSQEQINSLVRREIEETRREIKANHLREKTPAAWNAHITAGLELLQEAEEDLAHSNFRNVATRVQNILDDSGIKLDRQSDSFRQLCRALLRATIEMQREDLRLHDGGLAHDEQPYLQPNKPRIATPPQQTTSPLLTTVLEEYITEKQGQLRGSSSMSSYRTAIGWFVFVVGDKPVGEITNDDARYFRDTLRKLPAHRNKRAAYKGKSAEDLLALNLPQSECLSGKSINGHLSVLSGIFKWLRPRRLVDINVFEGVSTHEEDSRSYTEYTPEDLRTITTSALYDKSKHSRRGANTASRWWLPLLGLWTGARVGELTQMHLSDIREIDGILCAIVDDEEEMEKAKRTKRLKTQAARRIFPIHSALIDLGFEDYVSQVRAAGATRLLESIALGSEKPGSQASKWFNETYRDNYLPPSFKQEGKVFHSFRCTFITAAINAKVDLLDLQSMVGHEPKQLAETATYFGRRDVRNLKESIEMIQFPTVDLASLRDGWKRFKRL